jgi:hypothetical protein
MITEIIKHTASDKELKILLDRVEDYARVYVFAKQRQKGCDGLGEMANLKDEFKGVLDELLGYCKKKKYISDDLLCPAALDIDRLSDEIIKEYLLL